MNKKVGKNQKSVRVLMLTTSFPLSKTSSSGIFIYHLVNYLPEDIKVRVLVPGPDYPVGKSANPKDEITRFRYAPVPWQVLAHKPGGLPQAIKTHPVLIFLLPFFFLSMLISCIRMAKSHDIIHANWGINGAVAGLAGLMTGIPVITTLRGSDVKRFYHSRIDRLLLKICFWTNKKIISVNHAISSSMVCSFPKWPQKFITITNGVSREFFDVEIKKQPDSDSMVELISIGNLIKLKGHETILEAISGMPDKARVRLTLIGDGPLKKELMNKSSRLGLSGQVVFKGQVPHWEIPGCLEKAHIFILASFSEGRPNVVLEAMASGLPVIASDIHGMEELIEDNKNGLLFEPGNALELGHQIQRIINNPELAEQLGRVGNQSIIEKGLTWEKTADLYTQIYKDCIQCVD